MILHTKGNLIRNGYCPEGFPDGDWKKEHVEANGSQPLSIVESHNYSRHDKKYVTNTEIILGAMGT